MLRALSNAQAEVASYAFTTKEPQIGTVIVYTDGSFEMDDAFSAIQDTVKDTSAFSGAPLSAPPTNTKPSHRSHTVQKSEAYRFTVADCPGLVEDASLNVGLGHSFLRHLERSRILTYVVDLSTQQPEEELTVLKKELEAYKAGLSERVRLVVASKADLCRDPQEAGVKIERLQAWVAEHASADARVVVVSAAQRANMHKLISLIRDELVREAEVQSQES